MSRESMDIEQLLMFRLAQYGWNISATTASEIRREQIRVTIIVGKFSTAIFGHTPGGDPETYAQAFQRHYGEPLERRRYRRTF
jgi:hypothetical protein